VAEESGTYSNAAIAIVLGAGSVFFPVITGMIILSHATNPSMSGFTDTQAFIIRITDYCLVPLPVAILLGKKKWAKGKSAPGSVLDTAGVGVNLAAACFQGIFLMIYISW
jgi:hypothetical protein